MHWKPAKVNKDGLVSIPNRWLHIHYYEALNILFRFENSLRVFVYAVLKNELPDQWQDCSISMPGGTNTTIAKIAARRVGQADTFGYIGYDIRAPIMHLTSGELVELITAEGYWPKFKAYFKGSKDIIKNKLLEIGTIRNSLAHFRPIKIEDIEVVKQNSRHTLLEVEHCLANLLGQNLRVPTNTEDTWYRSLSTLGTDHIRITLFYSQDERWINVRLSVSLPTISKSQVSKRFVNFTVVNIATPNILTRQLELTKYLTYLSESMNYPTMDDREDIKLTKELNFVFRKDVLIGNANKVTEQIKEVLSKCAQEYELLLQDNLARGSLLETATMFSWWHQPEGEQGRWNFQYEELIKPYLPEHPVEYWGQQQYASDVVAGVRRFPWMPEDISQEDDWSD